MTPEVVSPPVYELPLEVRVQPPEAQKVWVEREEKRRLLRTIGDELLRNLVDRVTLTLDEASIDRAALRERRLRLVELEGETADLYAWRVRLPAEIEKLWKKYAAVLERAGRDGMASVQKRTAAVAAKAPQLQVSKLGTLGTELAALGAEGAMFRSWIQLGNPFATDRFLGVPGQAYPSALEVLEFLRQHGEFRGRLASVNGKEARS